MNKTKVEYLNTVLQDVNKLIAQTIDDNEKHAIQAIRLRHAIQQMIYEEEHKDEARDESSESAEIVYVRTVSDYDE